MAKKAEAPKSTGEQSESENETNVKVCSRCKKEIKNPNGDNGCGIHTEGDKTVTNCKE